jgi:hypothetical protein
LYLCFALLLQPLILVTAGAGAAVASGPKKIENRGGARPNSGPKPQALSVRQVDAMLKAADDRAKSEKKTLDDILLDFAYDAELSAKDRLASIKLFKDFSAVKITEGGDADQELGPAVYLPEQRPVLKAVK